MCYMLGFKKELIYYLLCTASFSSALMRSKINTEWWMFIIVLLMASVQGASFYF